jgi:Lipocalin-like domain
VAPFSARTVVPVHAMIDSLADKLVGSWELVSRIDRTAAGRERVEPSLGSDPVAFLVFDRAGRFAAQFMKRERGAEIEVAASAAIKNNSRAQGGYDAYFGSYLVEEDGRTVSTRLIGALSRENVGQVFRRRMAVESDTLIIELDTTTSAGEPVTRTLRWKRVA